VHASLQPGWNNQRETHWMPASIIVVASQKGGSGKTSCTLNLGVLAAQDGKTLLLDCDPQGSLMYWRERRETPQPETLSVRLSQLDQSILMARTQPNAYVFVDTPPHNDAEVSSAMRMADIILVPVRPTGLDLHAAEATLKLAAAMAKRTLVILTQCHAPRLIMEAPSVRQARAVFAVLGCRVAEQAIIHRATVEQSVASGMAVREFDPNGPADHEFRLVWKQVKRELLRP
jgi:chromosome partitioning protein